MASLLPIGGSIQLNPSPGGAATVVPLDDGGFAAVYRVENGPDVFTLYDDNFNAISDEITVTSDDQLAPQAAPLATGQFVVAWLDDDGNIQASIFNPDGSLSTGPVVLATPTDPSVGIGPPRIVGNAFGGFTAIWQDNATINGITGQVFIQSYDQNGDPVGDPITVVPPAVGPTDQASINDFRIAVLGDGTTVVAAQVQIDGVDSIMYSVNGGPLIQLAGGDPNYIYINPQITSLAAGGYVITYDFVDPNLVGSDSPDANWTTGGAVFTSTGNQHDFAIGTTVTTTANGNFAVDPSVITPLADGGFVVTFEPLTSPLGDGYLVDAQQFDAFGNAVGPVVLVAPQGFLPSVATSANGVVLDSYQFGAGVYLQAYNSAPTPLGPEPAGTSFGLNSVVSANSPGVAPLSAGGFVVVYQDADSNSWAQIFDFGREAVGAPFEVAAGGTQPVVASQTNGTFLVAWSTGSQIIGALYDNQGDLLSGPFDMSGPPSSLPVIDPALNAMANGDYMLAYETDLRDGGSHQVTIQEFDGSGNPIGPSVSQDYAPTNPLAPPKIAGLEEELFGSVTVIGIGNSIFAAIVSDPISGGGSAGIAGQQLAVSTQDSAPPVTPNTIQVSGGDDGANRAGAQVATIDDGNIVVVWDEAPASSATWNVVGQVMTPSGAFVGSQFTIATALPSNSPGSQLALSSLPDGGFVVTYDSGNGSMATQRFDAGGDALGGPVLMSAPGQGEVVTTVLADGSLLLLSDDTAQGGGTVTGQDFTLPAITMNWTGTVSTDLGTAGNWDIDVPPDSGHAMQFNLANGGLLTGSATAESAAFTGGGSWTITDGTIDLTQGLTAASPLFIDAGTITGGGPASIGVAGGAAVSVFSGAKVSFLGTGVGDATNQAGTLTLSGAGTSWTDTGTDGTGGLQAGASTGAQPGDGVVTVTLGALLIGSDTDVLGVTAGSDGALSVTAGGDVTDAGLVVGQAGTGVATVNDGTISSTGSLIIAQAAGGQGTLTVTGSSAAVSATGPMIVGDAGLGGLAIETAGTVKALGGAIIANTTSASNSAVDVTGAGSDWQVSGAMVVGDAGFGALSLSQGAKVTAGGIDEAAAASGDGVITVAGTGSALTLSGSLTVGDQAAGELSILSGGLVSAQDVTVGGTSALSSGNIDVEGAGSTLLIGSGGILNIGMAGGGSGAVTVGTGATLNFNGTPIEAGDASFNNNGGLVDPVSFEFTTVSNNGNGTNEYDLYLGNIGAIQINAGTGTWDAPEFLTGTSVPDAQNNINNLGSQGLWQIGAGGTLIMNGNTVDAGQVIQFGAATSTLVIGQIVNGGSPGVSGTAPVINEGAANMLPTFDAQLWGYVTGDKILFDNLTVASDSIVNGNTVNLFGAGDSPEGSLTFFSKNGSTNAAADIAATAAAAQIVPCFAAGTGIATTRGLVPVECIHPGDRVCTVLGGDTAEVIWVGHRKVDCARHPEPRKVWPVVVSAHAFGRGMPACDLMLSPDHAVFVDGVLIPIRLLINGRTVRQVLVDRVSYHHVELAAHDVLLANGMPAESYLDTGDRARFANGGGVVALHPDFSARAWEMNGCAPLVQTGPALTAVRKRLGADMARRRRVTRGSIAPGSNRPA